METVCDEDTYVGHLNVGAAGSNNDLNVLNSSPLYHAIVAGMWPPRTISFTVNERTRTMPCYLADGIYPAYPFFATPYPRSDSRKKRTYNRLQEALRKDVERLYAILTSRFNVLMRPARFTTVEKATQGRASDNDHAQHHGAARQARARRSPPRGCRVHR